ncbi:YebC-like,Integrase, N-terminal zinc-binding domain-like,Transcriptional regulator TACO1- [Cinara cedri]|uniref:YebC-like,Integrase, N-terminal zinc-binding domain-like,Transcriptional regulator TACO1 n=1 Tax=Cinara cedri TaxID=506608 RepID=A0A5E4N3D9_9HEMI|nr:YebC-like,Integrase, N-terminal zinc-binding domain-like,Transcriptional regulator TACO1- [Cinara cedri]
MYGNTFFQVASYCRSTLCNIILKRNAGHSKWSNIKHTKGANDLQKSLLFNRFNRQIKLAIRDQNDPNPETNLKLASVIEMAKKNSMPKDTILNALKKHSNSKAESVWFEVKGPRGTILLIHGLSENPRLFKQNLNTLVRKSNLAYCDSGAKHLFIHKGIIIVKPPTDLINADEECIEHAINAGAEEVETESDDLEPGHYKFICEPNNMNKVRKNLEKFNYDIVQAEEEHVALKKVSLSETEYEYIVKFINNVRGIPDTIEVYDNIA